jgi:feruloyl-CoA synthase
MSTASASAPPPPFRHIPWPARDIDTQRRADGSILMKSRVQLDPVAPHVPSFVRRWGLEAPDRLFLAQRRGPDRAWSRLTYGQALQQMNALTQALLDLGLPAGPVAILSGNSLEHALIMLAAMQAHRPAAPVSPSYSLVSQDHVKLRHVFGLIRPAVIFMQDGPPFDKALAALDLTGIQLIHVERPPTGRSSLAFADLLHTPVTSAVQASVDAIRPEDTGKLLFTSGSTGMPKAVINTHRTMCANTTMMVQCRPRNPHDPLPTLLDWLPWNHTMGGNALMNPLMAEGGSLYIDDGRPMPGAFDETLRNLREVSPTYFANVPAGYAMLATALEQDEALARSFFRQLQLFAYGGATLPDDLYRRLQALAIRHTGERIVMNTGWGATETGPTATSTYWNTERVGLIGLPYPGVELKLVPAGPKYEIRLRGPIITPGYHGQPELTARAFDEEGFYKIGDAATFVDPERPEEGLVFAGRVVEDFKLSSGTFVHVGTLRVAAIAAASPAIQDALVAGQDRADIALLAWPNLAACRMLCGKPLASIEEVIAAPEVRETIRKGLLAHNASATGSSLKVSRVLLMSEPPSIDGNELTDKGYINQRAGLDRRAALVEQLYADPLSAEVIVIG